MTGGLTPAKANPAPVALMPEIVMALEPEFVTVSERVLVVDNCTEPKLRLDGLPPTDPDEVVPLPEIWML